MLSTGYVACYLCLYDALSRQEEEGGVAGGKEVTAESRRVRCPITGVWLPGGIDEIRKVLP